jgi:hypothetical protein
MEYEVRAYNARGDIILTHPDFLAARNDVISNILPQRGPRDYEYHLRVVMSFLLPTPVEKFRQNFAHF